MSNFEMKKQATVGWDEVQLSPGDSKAKAGLPGLASLGPAYHQYAWKSFAPG